MANNQHTVIVHVDDREANRYLVQKTLKSAGFEVLEAETGMQGLELIRSSEPDLVILDIRLPDISGFEVCRRLKADPMTQGIPVLQISSQLTTVDSRVEGLDSGADAYLTSIRPTEIVATVKALLRARKAEELAIAKAAEWSATFNAVRDPILLLNSDGNIVQTNTSADQFLASLTEADKAGLFENWSDQLANQKAGNKLTEFHDIAIQNKSYRMSLDEVPKQDNLEARFVAILTDVTTLVEAETAIRRSNDILKHARDEAITASRAKSVFMSSMSHEFRTPLNAIMGYAELMQEVASDRGDDTSTQDLARIVASAKHLLSLISDVLDIAKIEAGRATLSVSTFEIAPLVCDVVSTVEPLAKTQKNTIRTEISSDVDTISSDPTKLRQILLNLLGNACKFTQEGTIEVKVKLVENGNGPHVDFSVSDTGIGISEEKLAIVFDAFEQGSQNGPGAFGGTGLGLAISKKLAELLGGCLTATSQKGDGSTFTLQLPLQ